MAMDIARNISTARELFEAGDIGPCELVRGRLRVMTPAGYEHGVVSMNVAFHLMIHVKRKRLGRVCTAETGFVLRTTPDTVRAPDVGFVSSMRVVSTKRYFPGAPDFAVEVVSPGDGAAEVAEKVADWLGSGARLVWVADTARRTIVSYAPAREPRTYGAGESVSGEDVVPGFSLSVDDAFDV